MITEYTLLLCLMHCLIIEVLPDSIPVLLKYQQNVTYQIGSSFELTCPIKLSNTHAIQQGAASSSSSSSSSDTDMSSLLFEWTIRNLGVNVINDARYKLVNENKIVKISDARVSDSGVYKCRGITGFGSKEAVFNVDILENNACPTNGADNNPRRPCFLDKNMQESKNKVKTIHRSVGSSVELRCDATGYPEPKYTWLFHNTIVAWVKKASDARKPNLIIDNVEHKFSGHYTCQVENDVGKISFTFALVVKDSPLVLPKIVKEMENLTVQAGSYAELVGRIHCQCTPIIQWLHRVEIDQGPKQNSQVALPKAAPSEAGESFTILDVKSKPKDKSADNSFNNNNNDNDNNNKNDGDISIENHIINDGLIMSKLKFKSVKPKHSGKYVLLTMKGNVNEISYKTVFLNVLSEKSSSLNSKANSPPKIIMYIAIPLGVLVLCTFLTFYCLVRRTTPPIAFNQSDDLKIQQQQRLAAPNNATDFRLLQHYSTTTSGGPIPPPYHTTSSSQQRFPSNHNNQTAPQTLTSSLHSNNINNGSNYSNNTHNQSYNSGLAPLLLQHPTSTTPTGNSVIVPAPSSNSSMSLNKMSNFPTPPNIPRSTGSQPTNPSPYNHYNYYNPYHHQHHHQHHQQQQAPQIHHFHHPSKSNSSVPSDISSQSNKQLQQQQHHHHYSTPDQLSTGSSSITNLQNNTCQHCDTTSTTNNNNTYFIPTQQPQQQQQQQNNNNFQLPPSLCFDTETTYPTQHYQHSTTPYFPGHNSSSSASLTFS